MTLALFVIAMFVMLGSGHIIGLLIPHRPAPQEVQHARRELAADAWASLLEVDIDDPGPNWKPDRWIYSAEEYKQIRRQK